MLATHAKEIAAVSGRTVDRCLFKGQSRVVWLEEGSHFSQFEFDNNFKSFYRIFKTSFLKALPQRKEGFPGVNLDFYSLQWPLVGRLVSLS